MNKSNLNQTQIILLGLSGVSILLIASELRPFWRVLINWQGLLIDGWDDWDKLCNDKRTWHSIGISIWSQDDDEDNEVDVEILVDDVWGTSGFIKFIRLWGLLKLTFWWSWSVEFVEVSKLMPEVDEFEVKGGANEEYFLSS